MLSAPLQVLLLQIQSAQLIQVFRSQAREFIEQLAEGFSLALSKLRPAIEALKHLSLAKLQEHLHTRHPIGAFGMDQMADDIKDAHGFFAFISEGPFVRQIAQKRVERGGSAREKRNSVVQVLFHPAPRFVDSNFREIPIVFIPGRLSACP